MENTTNDEHSEMEKKSEWVKVEHGFLKIGHKPGGKKLSFEQLIEEDTTTIFTILGEKEGALNIGKTCSDWGLGWIWLPLSNAGIPDETLIPEITDKLEIVKTKLDNREKIYVHCSAGLHRTGMITNCILRYVGFDEAHAYQIIQQLRPITAKEVGQPRLDFGSRFYGGAV